MRQNQIQKQREAELEDALYQHNGHPVAGCLVELMDIWKKKAIQEFSSATDLGLYQRAQEKYNMAEKIKRIILTRRAGITDN